MKQWLKVNLIILATFIVLIAGLNFFMDPFWCFSHSHKYNSVQKGTNERQQKANYIYFTEKKFDTLLLGSSRTTYMNHHAFTGMKVFNYSAKGMRPKEYLTYIDFTVHDCHQPIKTIILGVDFFGYLNYGSFMFNDTATIVNATKSPLYRLKTLFTFDALNTSFKNLRDYSKHDNRVDRYNRDNVKSSFKHPTDLTAADAYIQNDALGYSQAEYSSTPNPNFSKILSTIKSRYPDKQFIIYTTPVSKLLFNQLIKTGHYQDYENWLRTLVATFGAVHHFMYSNTVTENYLLYFADCNHPYVDTNTLIAHRILHLTDPNIPSDFGIILTKDNIEEKLKVLRRLNRIQASL
jgi:hypothetical protein